MPQPQRVAPAAGIAACIAAACVIIAPFTASREGFVSRARPDPAAIPTYCFGETQNVDALRIYSRTECQDLLRKRLARDYAPKVLACIPGLADPRRANVFAALLDASYNAGPVAVCASPMARAARALNWRAACNAFPGWFVTARNRRTGVRIRLNGLVSRRAAERQLCLKGSN